MSAEQVRVLLVEDDAVDRMAFLRHVEKEHLPYQARVAESIAAARAILEKEKFDVVLLDHNLPDGSGFELLAHVFDTPTIFVTGSESPENAVRAMKSGASDYLLKDHERNYLQFMPLAVERALRQRFERQQLHESQELFRKSFSEAPIGKAFVQLDGRFARVNRTLCEIFGASQEELLSNGFLLIFGRQPEPGCVAKLFPASSGSAPQRIERGSRNKNGDSLILQVDAALVSEASGSSATCVLNIQDITARRRAEESHARLEKHLYQAQKMEALGNLAGGVAHEFNNMLGAIIGYTELSRMELGEANRVTANLDQVLKASHRAKEIIQQILMFSRRQDLKRELIHVQPLMADALKLIRPTIPGNVEIVTESRPGAPPIMGNATQIHQALLNICTNSWHAMRENGRIVIANETVSLRRETMPPRIVLPEGDYVALSIADNGQGMDDATLQRVFEPFFTTKSPGRGSGLGMPVVDGIMKAHDGAVSVSSEMGKGTKVVLYFPVVSAEAPARPAPKKPALPTGQGEQIMLVDDELSLVQLGSMILQRLGYKVQTFTSPTEAAEAFRRAPEEFDLIITDLTMPAMTGLELTAAIHQVRPGVPVILASGYVEETIREEAAFLGIGKILAKPLSSLAMAEAARALLSKEK